MITDGILAFLLAILAVLFGGVGYCMGRIDELLKNKKEEKFTL